MKLKYSKPKIRVKKINHFELTEKQIQSQILEYLNLSGHYCWRNNTGQMTAIDKYGKQRRWRAGIKGSSDIIGISKDGKFIAIECKRPGKKVTQDQQWFLDEISKRGGIGIVATSYEQIRKLL